LRRMMKICFDTGIPTIFYSVALQPVLQFLSHIDSRYDSLGGGSARLKAPT
jgi:hypothetical protein